MKGRFGIIALLVLATAESAGAKRVAAQSPLAEAQQEYSAGQYHRAVDLLSPAAQRSPEDASLPFWLGRCFYELGDFSRAVTSFERSVQLAQNDSNYHDWLGKAYGRKAEQSMWLHAIGWARKTHREFETAVKLDPHNLEAQRDLIRFETNAPDIIGGGDDRAMKSIEELEKIDPVVGALALGEYYNSKKKFDLADQTYSKVFEEPHARIGVFFEVADYYRDRKFAPKMAGAVEKAGQMDPNDRRLTYYRGVSLVLSRKDLPEAETLLLKYLETVAPNSEVPSHASAHEWLGVLFESESRFSQAAEQYRAALELDQHDKAARDALKRVEKKD